MIAASEGFVEDDGRRDVFSMISVAVPQKKIGAEMSEETKSVLMDILGEDKEDK